MKIKKARDKEVSPDQVRKAGGRFYVACNCGKRKYLDAYGAAHLGQCDLSGPCERCKATITITKGRVE